jgi:uncharacterized delta-60 repeat protein
VVVAGGRRKFALARYTAAGTLDPTLSGDGKLTTGFGVLGLVSARDVVLQPDGKIVAVGEVKDEYALVRYRPGGSLDRTFSGDGRQRTAGPGPGVANAVALQSDGRIVVAGGFNRPGGAGLQVLRYLADGELDRSFSGDGIVVTPVLSDTSAAQDVVVQADGRIVVVGWGAAAGGARDFVVARYLPDGSLDGSFSGDGKGTVGFGSQADDRAHSVALQPDGSLVLAGESVLTPTSSGRFALARVLPNGDLDPTFSGDGRLTTDIGSGNDVVNAVALRADGAIVTAGTTAGTSRSRATCPAGRPTRRSRMTAGAPATSGHPATWPTRSPCSRTASSSRRGATTTRSTTSRWRATTPRATWTRASPATAAASARWAGATRA